MCRRGPDASGVYEGVTPSDRSVQMLHSRLAIIDLDHRADQPFRLGPRVTVFNGELYNYVELRRKLESEGRAFATSSDTEVLAQSLATWGADALDACEGMWAFAMFDERDGSLWLCRDRFGEKPLYVLRDGDRWYFASEPKMIAALRGRPLTANLDHLRRYLVNGYKALYKQPATFFEGLDEVPAATLVQLPDAGPPTAERYWKPEFRPDGDMSYDEAVAGARAALIDAVGIRLRADVPLAFCMSGGVDSNALIGIAHRVFGHQVHGFTVVNTDERYEEQAVVDEVVRQLGIRHTGLPVTPHNFLDGLRVLVRQHDAPVYTVTYYAHFLLQERIAQHGYRISISGTGADELFTGYFDHHLAYLREVRTDPARHAQALQDWVAHVQPVVRNPHLSDPELFVRDPGFRDYIYLHADRFASWLHTPWHEPFREEAYTEDLLRNRMLNELLHEAVPVILHEDDRNAMYHSIENRSPFLDRHLLDFTLRIPTRHLIQRGYGKAVLRDAMRGLVPDVVLDNHRKVGFNAPIFSFLDVEDSGVRAELLRDSPVWDLVRPDRIAALLDKPRLENSESKFLFSFINTKLFLEEFTG